MKVEFIIIGSLIALLSNIITFFISRSKSYNQITEQFVSKEICEEHEKLVKSYFKNIDAKIESMFSLIEKLEKKIENLGFKFDNEIMAHHRKREQS